jgi:hypothetical protein
MNATTPVERVKELLRGSGYRQLSEPLSIAGLTFDMPAAFVGAHPSPDLILVADTAFETDERILRKVEGVARALDVARSRRPLTTILVGPRPTSQVLDAMTKVSRVLPVGAFDEDLETSLHNWLAVLMPLGLPEPSDVVTDPLAEIVSRSGDLRPEVASLVHLAPQGAEVINKRLQDMLFNALQNANGGLDADDDQDPSVVGQE